MRGAVRRAVIFHWGCGGLWLCIFYWAVYFLLWLL